MTILQLPFTQQAINPEEQGGRQPPHIACILIDISMRSRRLQMLFDILQTITDFVVLLTRLTIEELTDEQRMALIDQYIHLEGLEAAFQFDLHGMLLILITMLSTYFG